MSEFKDVFELTLEQQFQMRKMQDSVQTMSREQALELLLQAARLVMVKENLIRYFLQNGVGKS